jgi:hypothetical protein
MVNKQAVYKNHWFLISLIFIFCILIISPALATPTYILNPDGSISAHENTSAPIQESVTGFSAPSGTPMNLDYFIWGQSAADNLNISIFKVQGSTGLSQVTQGPISIKFRDNVNKEDGSNLMNYNIPVNLVGTNNIILGCGTVSLYARGNYSGSTKLAKDVGIYDIKLDIISWSPPTGITGTYRISLKNTTIQKNMGISVSTYEAPYEVALITHATFSHAYSGGTSYLIASSYNTSLVSSRNIYKFKNSIFGTHYSSNLTVIDVVRSGLPSGWTALSNVTIANSLGHLLYDNESSLNDLHAESYYFPVNVSIWDKVIGYRYNETWFPVDLVYAAPPTTYSYAINPTSSSINDAVMGTLSSSDLNLTPVIFFSITDTTETNNTYRLYDSTHKYYYNFLKNLSGYWNAYEYSGTGGYTIDMNTTTIPNNLPLKFTKGGLRNLTIKIADENEIEYTIYSNVTILDAGAYTLTLYPLDYVNRNFISGANISVQSYPLDVWSNKTVYSTSDCNWLLDTGFYNIFADASGYKAKYAGATYVSASKTEQIILYPDDIVSENISLSTVYIGVAESESLNPISGATVTIQPDGISQQTSYAGKTTFILENGTAYIAVATASGYQSTTVTFTPNTASFYFDIAMGEGGAVPTAVTPIYTTIPTVTPALLPNTGINVTCGSFSNQTTILSIFENMLACNGITLKANIDLIIALAIIIICAAMLGKYAKAIGALIGAISGFIISVALQLIEFWVLLAMIIISVIIVAAILTKKE